MQEWSKKWEKSQFIFMKKIYLFSKEDLPIEFSKKSYDIGEVEYAILETSGQVTVIPKPNKRPTTPEDFNLEPKYEGIPYDLVVDGKVMHENLKTIEIPNCETLEISYSSFFHNPLQNILFYTPCILFKYIV